MGRYNLSGLAGPVVLRKRLADAFAAQAGYAGSWNSASTCRTAFYQAKTFCDFLATIEPPLASFEELRGGHWNDFQLFLRTERDQGPESLGGTLTIMRTLLCGSRRSLRPPGPHRPVVAHPARPAGR